VVSDQRNVEVMEAGLLTINDTFTLRAPLGETLTISSFKVGFHSSFIDERRVFEVLQDGAWKLLDYNETNIQVSGFREYELKLPTSVTLTDTSSFKIRAWHLFINRVSWENSSYVARIPIYPMFAYKMSSFTFNLTLPPGAVLDDIISSQPFTNSSAGDIWSVGYVASVLTWFQNDNVSIVYKPSFSDEYLLDCELLKRGVSIFDGGLRIEDAYVLINRGASIGSFHLKLPSGASDVGAWDGIGTLNVEYIAAKANQTSGDLFVIPRSSFNPINRWSFTVGYTLPSEGRLASAGDKFTLTYPVYGFPQFVHDLELTVTLPEGGEFIASDPAPSSVIQISSLVKQANMDFSSVAPFDRPQATVEYGRSIFWSAFRPLQWVLIAAGAIGSVYILGKRRRVQEEKEEKKPAAVKRSKMEEFVRLYKERLALLVELEELEQGVEQKKVGREHFERRSAEIALRQRDLLTNLSHLEAALETEEPAFAGKIEDIKKAEGEVERANTDIRNLDTRFRARRITRQDFEQRRKEALRRRRGARIRVEQLIASIEQEF
jgi:Asp-tRNA(Asn)/Glu-tRNA(Gln) amidotransferase C subunit